MRVLAPAPDRTSTENAGVVTASDNCGAAANSKNLHRNITAGVRSITQLTEGIVAPALDSTFRGDRTGMSNTRRDRMRLATCHRDEARE